MERLRSGTGSSTLDDAWAAGRAAAEAAQGVLSNGAETPALVLVYASVRYDLVQVLAGVRSVTDDAELAGMSSSGHFCRRCGDRGR